jgi:trk system potassium uptake protein
MQDSAQNTQSPNEPYTPRPGDKKYRVPRIITERFTLPKIRPVKRNVGISLLSFVYGFAAMIAVGTALLMMPFCSNSHQFTSFIDCLFTSTSAVCVTGLVVVDTLGHWNIIGQIVMVVLVQAGGLGFMISSTLLLIATGRKIGLRERILLKESAGLDRIGGVIKLARNIVLFTLGVESAGAIIFFFRFDSQYEFPASIWVSIFHSIAAFNNAGFDLFGGFRSLSGYTGDHLFLLITAVLIILGGISFVVINNIYKARGLHHSSIDTKLVLLISFILLAAGTLIVVATEYNNPQTLGNLPLPSKILNAFFLSVTSRSAGFSTISVGSLTTYTLFLTMMLMFIGGAAGSTAGGIKVNTLGLIAATIWGTIKGKVHPGAFGREFSLDQIYRAMTFLVLSLAIIALAFFILSITETFHSLDVLFETVSAYGIVGLSTGITPQLSVTGKVVIIIMMFVGRLGPLTLIMSLASRKRASIYRFPEESVRIG